MRVHHIMADPIYLILESWLSRGGETPETAHGPGHLAGISPGPAVYPEPEESVRSDAPA